MKQKRQLEESPLKFAQIARLKNVSADYSHLGQDYILSHMTTNTSYLYAPMSRRFDGHTMIIGVKGIIKITIDLDTMEVPPNSLLFIAPEQVFKPIDWEGEELDAYMLFMSNKFVYDLSIDFNVISTQIFTSSKAVLTLPPDKVSLLVRYLEMLHRNATEQSSYTRHIARALMSAAAYQMMAYAEDTERSASREKPHSRKLGYVQTFLRLVRTHHRHERAIGFYADKMFISPKYLSLIIKEATGRSAAEWIDQYVLQEAKNLLRYSGKNVQQVAYELNFTNQSSFGKYFKHLTGLSPTQFLGSLS